MRALRVGMYTDTVPPRADGIAVSLEAVCGALGRAGTRLDVVAPKRSTLTTKTVSGFRPWGRDFNVGLVWPPAHRQVTSADDYDVVHVQSMGPVGIAGIYAARRACRPVVLTWHTDLLAYTRHYPEVALGMALARMSRSLDRSKPVEGAGRVSVIAGILRMVDAIIAPTTKALSQLEGLGFGDKTLVLANPTLPLPWPRIEPSDIREELGIPTNGPVVLCVGRLSGEKNNELLLRAFAGMKGDAHLCLVGPTRGRRRLSGLARALNIEGRVRFVGVVPRSDLAAYYAAASILVVPSRTETQALVAHEGEAFGLPIVVVDPGLASGSRVLSDPRPVELAKAIEGHMLPPPGSYKYPNAGEYRPSAEEHVEGLLRIYGNVMKGGVPCSAA